MSLHWEPRYVITCDCPRCLACEHPIAIRNPYDHPSHFEEIYEYAAQAGWTIDREANLAIAPNNECEAAQAAIEQAQADRRVGIFKRANAAVSRKSRGPKFAALGDRDTGR